MLKKVICVFMLLGYQAAFCEIVMPILYGWYTDIKHDYEDSCFLDHYKYTNLETTTAFELAQKVLSVDQRNDCQWQRVTLKEQSWLKSDDFPGTYEQWETLSQNSSAVTQEATRFCLDDHGQQIDSISVYIYPSYRCPAGSFYSLDNSDGDYELACTTQPMGCFADIVGRDLDTKTNSGTDPDIIGIKNLGHIGLVYPNMPTPAVLEVLDEENVVQVNDIDSFKNKTRFWGGRYGTPQKNNLESTEGIMIVTTASEQMTCAPEYTLTWSFSPCNSGKPAKFRCDSFVYYSYLKGASIDLGYTTLLTYPSTIFNSMFNCREQLGYPCVEDIPAPEIETFNSYVLNPANILERKLTNIMSESTIDLKNLDNVTRNYILDKDVSRENKINILWSLLLEYQANLLKFDYLADVLSELEPIEKAEEIIGVFNKTDDFHLKYKLLNLLIGSMTIDNKNNNHVDNINSFLINLLQNTHDEELLRTLVVNYPESIMDENTYLIMLARLNEQKNMNPQNFKKIVINSNFWYQWLGLANKNKKFNQIWVEKLFNQSQEYSQYESFHSSQGARGNSPYLISKDILKAFNFGLKSREKNNKAFHSALAQKNPQESNMNEYILPDEVADILKRVKEEKIKRNAWLKNHFNN